MLQNVKYGKFSSYEITVNIKRIHNYVNTFQNLNINKNNLHAIFN